MSKYILDCDTGIDDALAIGILIGLAGEDILAISASYGMAPLPYVYRNCKYLLEVLERKEIPVYAGSTEPLSRERIYSGNFHGKDGLGNTLRDTNIRRLDTLETNSVEQIYSLIQKYPNQIKLISTGPLTNTARLLNKYPDVSEKLDELIIMGGAFLSEGNVNKFAEANIYIDPEAADIVFKSSLKKLVVPLDVTRKTLLSREIVANWNSSTDKTANIYGAFVSFYLDAYAKYHPYLKGCALHDPLAATLAIKSELIQSYVNINVKVDLSEDLLGRTVEDFSSENKEELTKIVLAVDVEKFEKLFIENLPFN